MRVITTIYEDKKRKQFEEQYVPRADDINVEGEVVNFYPQIKFQKIEGFGGAFTESFGYTMSQMSKEKQDEIMEAYFGEDGLGYEVCRLHLDSCDFSLSNYSAVTDPTDTELKSFSLERDSQYILPYVRYANEISTRKIEYLMSPWSPPAYMKSNGQKNKGASCIIQV